MIGRKIVQSARDGLGFTECVRAMVQNPSLATIREFSFVALTCDGDYALSCSIERYRFSSSKQSYTSLLQMCLAARQSVPAPGSGRFAEMYEIKRSFILLFVLFVASFANRPSFGESAYRSREVHRLYIGSFGSTPDAVYLRNKLLLRLTKSRTIVVVGSPADADAVLSGSATMRLLGYYNSNPRIRYRNSASVAVYDARMTVELEDRQGRPLWSGNLKPRFWGSQYVSDNVVNQVSRHVIEVLRQREHERNPSSDC